MGYDFPVIEDEASCWFVAHSADPILRAFSAASPFADVDTIAVLLGDENPDVVNAALMNPRLVLDDAAARSVVANDANLASILRRLTPPPTGIVVWLYSVGGSRTREAARTVLTASRSAFMAAVRADAVRDADMASMLRKVTLTDVDVRELANHPDVNVRKWVMDKTRNVKLLAEFAEGADDDSVRLAAAERIERLNRRPATLF